MTNQLAISIVKKFEGCNLVAYQDQVGVWTIGYGATGPDIKSGTIWSLAQAESDLEARLGRIEVRVATMAQRDLTEGQAAALISFAYNLGEGALASSQLLQQVRAGQWLVAAREFIHWDHAGGHEIKGLLRRRLTEALLFIEHSP